MVKAASHTSGISNEPSVIGPLNLLQQRLDVYQKLEGESVIFLLRLVGRAIPEMPEELGSCGAVRRQPGLGSLTLVSGRRARELDVPFEMRLKSMSKVHIWELYVLFFSL